MTAGTIYWIGFVIAWFPIGLAIFQYFQEEESMESDEFSYLMAGLIGFVAILLSFLWLVILPSLFLGAVVKKMAKRKEDKIRASE